MITIMTTGYLPYYKFATLYDTHVLVLHMVKMFIKCHSYNFTWIAYKDQFWKEQKTLPQNHAMAILVALFNYKIHAADMIHFLGGTYRGNTEASQKSQRS